MFGSKVELKSDKEIALMRKAGLVSRAALEAARSVLVPGVTTAEVDAASAQAIADAGATSNFLGYYGYPATVCISVNDEIVHGIPGDRVIRVGDLVSVDGGAIVDGWHGDNAFTTIVGDGGDPADQRLSDVTEESMWAGIATFASAKRIGDVGAAIEGYIMDVAPDLSVVEDFTGHGIGTQMHMEPEVLNYGAKNRGPRVRPGMVICIEPIVVRGDQANTTLDDEWTVITNDGSRAAHWENTVAMHQNGIWVLTEPDGGEARLAPYGVTPVPLPE